MSLYCKKCGFAWMFHDDEGFCEPPFDHPPDDPDFEPSHPHECICADCAGAELTADND